MKVFSDRDVSIPVESGGQLTERNHQGVGNELLRGTVTAGSGKLIFKKCLGGFLKFYH